MTDRFLRILPGVALVLAAGVTVLASLTARRLSRAFSHPVSELVEWTERIARSQPLPSEAADTGVPEFRRLRESLRTMSAELAEARRRELEAARLRAWTDMARKVAHEIKNPLTPMRLAASALSQDANGARGDAARILLEEISRLDEMARSFAQLGRAPEGPPAPVDLEELVTSLATRHGTQQVPITVTREGDIPLLVGHLDVLDRCLRNLFINAVEASPTGGPGVRVALTHRGGNVLVSVRDRGPGIPDELLESIWLPDVSTKPRGSGLGLALVRQGVITHGGEARARNLEDGGAEFEISLPVAGPDASPAIGGGAG